MVSLLNVVSIPLDVVVLGLLHEGLRVVLHSLIGPAALMCETCYCDQSDYEIEDPAEGAPDRRANSEGKAVVTSNESRPTYNKVDHVPHKDPFGELISISPVATLAVLGLPLALRCCVMCCNECVKAKRHSMHAEPRESARQSWSDWMVPGRLATVRQFEAQDRWEERSALEGA